MAITYKNYPIRDCVAAADQLIKQGWKVHQKFSCQHCGTRQSMSTPNVFFEKGTCEECGKMTDIKRSGCNYLIMK